MKPTPLKTKLEEGNYYPFKISGSVVLPDGEDCFVLTDVNGVKHLLYKSYYQHYGLKLNTEIRCRIDKINCTGKIFIEPEHPLYEPGKSYTFVFQSYRTIRSAEGHPEHFAVLMNGHKQEILLSADEIERPLIKGDRLKAVVERIKKGNVHLSMATQTNDYSGMETGKQYHLTVAGETSTDRVYTYYVLKNDAGKEFRIRKKFYSEYGIKKGDSLVCTLLETRQGQFLEPAHPVFEPGFHYTFEIVEETTIKEYPDQHKKALWLHNPYGQDILVKTEEVAAQNRSGGTVRCRIVSIKKGQVFLACKD